MLAEIGEQVLLLRNWWPALPALAFVFTKPGSEVCGISLKIIIYKKKKYVERREMQSSLSLGTQGKVSETGSISIPCTPSPANPEPSLGIFTDRSVACHRVWMEAGCLDGWSCSTRQK